MKTIKVSDEIYERLKTFLVDPFDDTPDTIIARLVEIADKAKKKWSAWEEPAPGVAPAGMRHRPAQPQTNQQETEQPVIL